MLDADIGCSLGASDALTTARLQGDPAAAALLLQLQEYIHSQGFNLLLVIQLLTIIGLVALAIWVRENITNIHNKDLDAEHDSQTCSKSLEAVGARAVVTHKVEGLDHHMPKKADAVGKAAYDKMLSELANSVKAFTPAPAPAPAAPPPGKSIRAIDNLMNDPNTKMFTWEIPPEAPPGWGRGYENGEAYLIEHCGLYRPEHPKWKELHPEGVEEYWKKKNAEDPRNRNKTVEVS